MFKKTTVINEKLMRRLCIFMVLMTLLTVPLLAETFTDQVFDIGARNHLIRFEEGTEDYGQPIITFNLAFGGSITLTPYEGFSDRYKVLDVTSEMTPDGHAEMKMDGMEIDLSD